MRILASIGAAIGQFRQVVTQAPEQPGGWGNLGVMLKIEGRFDAAFKAYDRAIALAPQDARIRVNRTVALLHAGRLEEAWPEFEWRLALPEHRGMGVDRLMPPLSRLGDVTGRRVLVTHEDGFGDTIQFMRYVPLLAQRGARVIAWVPKTLERVLRSVVGVAEVLTGDIPFPPFDWHCPFVSLPRVFETSLATIPNAVPYMSVDAESGSALEGTTAYRWHAGRAGVGRSGTPTSPWVRCGRCQTQHQTRDIRTAGGGGGRALHQFADRPGGGSGEDAAIRA